MFDRESRSTIKESVEESADSAVESADSTTDSAKKPLKIGLWVWAYRVVIQVNIFQTETAIEIELVRPTEVRSKVQKKILNEPPRVPLEGATVKDLHIVYRDKIYFPCSKV